MEAAAVALLAMMAIAQTTHALIWGFRQISSGWLFGRGLPGCMPDLLPPGGACSWTSLHMFQSFRSNDAAVTMHQELAEETFVLLHYPTYTELVSGELGPTERTHWHGNPRAKQTVLLPTGKSKA
jgi:hypothetical protein